MADVCRKCGEEIPKNGGCSMDFLDDACCIKSGHVHPWLPKPKLKLVPKEKNPHGCV